MAERKPPGYGLVLVKEFSGPSAESKLEMLRYIPDTIQSSYFVSYAEVFGFENVLYAISEYMTISLLQNRCRTSVPPRESCCSDYWPGDLIPFNTMPMIPMLNGADSWWYRIP